MRLFEADTKFLDDLELILRTQIKRADAKHAPDQLSYEALSNMLHNIGYGPISFDDFQKIYDENPNIQPYVSNHNEKVITLATKKDKKVEPELTEPLAGPTVDQLASRGVSDLI